MLDVILERSVEDEGDIDGEEDGFCEEDEVEEEDGDYWGD